MAAITAHEKVSPNPDRMEIIEEGNIRFKTDGLVDLRYKILDLQFKRLYTYVLVEIPPYNVTALS